MTKAPAHLILCLAALGCGGGRQPPHAMKPQAKPIANTAAPGPELATPAPTPAPTVSRPLTNASGRPACGNVTSRAPQHCDSSATSSATSTPPTTGATKP